MWGGLAVGPWGRVLCAVVFAAGLMFGPVGRLGASGCGSGGCGDGVDVTVRATFSVDGDFDDEHVTGAYLKISGAEGCQLTVEESHRWDELMGAYWHTDLSETCRVRQEPCADVVRTFTVAGDPGSGQEASGLAFWMTVPECFALIVNRTVPPTGEGPDHAWYYTNYWGSVPGDLFDPGPSTVSIQVVPKGFIEGGRNWRRECDKLRASGGSGSGPGGGGGATSGTSAPAFSSEEAGTVGGFRDSIPLGSLSNGQTAGLIEWSVDDLGDPDTFTPAILRAAPWTNVVIVGDNDVVSQVFHPEAGLANVTNVAGASFDVEFYPTNQVTGGSPYVPSGSPSVVWHFGREVDGSATNLWISRAEGAALDVSRVSATGGGWVIESLGTNATSGGFLRMETRTSETQINGSVTDTVETVFVEDLRTSPASTNSHVVRTYRDFAWGRELLTEERFLAGGSASEVTSYAYDANTEKLLSVQYPDGRWTKHVYGGSGQATTNETWEPWLDLPLAQANASNCRRTITSCDGSGRVARREVLVEGQTVELTVYPTPGLSGEVETQEEHRYTSSGASLVTTTKKYATGGFGGRLLSVTHPDGRMESHAYETNETGVVVAEIVTNGTTASPSGVANLTTLDRSEFATDGRLLLRETYALSSSGFDTATPIETEEHLYDSEGVETNVFRNGRSVFAPESWVAGRLLSVTDEMGITTTYGYDDFGRRYMETRGGVTTTNAYDLEGRVVATVRYGGGLALASTRGYDASGEVAWEIDERGLTTGYARGTSQGGGRIETVTLPSGGTRVTEYFRDGQVKSVSGAGVVAEQHAYEVTSGGLRVETVTTGPGTSRYRTTVSDWAGRVVQEKRPGWGGELTTTYGYESSTGRLITRQDPGLATRHFLYDDAGQPAGEGLDLDGGGLDLDGTDRITETPQTYQKIGDDWYRVTAAIGYLTDDDGTPTTLSETREQLGDMGPTTLSHTVRLDAFGAATDTTVTFNPATGEVTTTVDSPDSDLDAVTVSLGGRVLSQTTHTVSEPVEYGYDGLGRLQTVTDARDETTTYTYYSSSGQLYTVTDPTDRTTTYSYHGDGQAGAGQVDTVTNPDSTTREYAYDLMGRVTEESGTGTYRVAYDYDDYGQMYRMGTYRDAGGSPDYTVWDYHAATGLLSAKRYADSSATSFTYNDLGQVAVRTWARGVTATYGYNAAGDLTSIDYSDSTPDVTYTPDRAGRRVGIGDAAGTHALSYLADGTLSGDSVSGTGPLAGMSVSGTFVGGRRTELAALNGAATLAWTGYGHDSRGRLQYVFADSTSDRADLAYQNNGDRPQQVAYYAGGQQKMTRTYSHDDAGRVTGVQNGSLSGHAYGLDAGGRRISASRQDGSSWAYGYNARGEVVAGTNFLSGGGAMPGGIFGYGFDDIGNRTAAVRGGDPSGGGTVAETYGAANELNQIETRQNSGASWVVGEALAGAAVKVNGQAAGRVGSLFWKRVDSANGSGPVVQGVETAARLAGGGGDGKTLVARDTGTLRVPRATEAIGYDPDGNMVTNGLWTLEWDAENRLRAIQSREEIPTEHRLRLEFDYDAQWRRIAKRVYAWEGSGYASTPQTSIRFLYDGWNLVAEVDGSGTAIRTYHWGLDLSGTMGGAGGVGGLLFTRHHGAGGPKTYYALYDGNGNVTGLADPATGAAAARYEYGPFGEPMRATGPVAATNPVGFSTKYTDEETGLVYYGYRYYNPVVGRWLSRDPAGHCDVAALHGFARNDAITKIDALGNTVQAYDGTHTPAPETLKEITKVTVLGGLKASFKVDFGQIENYWCGTWPFCWKKVIPKGTPTIIKFWYAVNDLPSRPVCTKEYRWNHEMKHLADFRERWNMMADEVNKWEGAYCKSGCADLARDVMIKAHSLRYSEYLMFSYLRDAVDYPACGAVDFAKSQKSKYDSEVHEVNRRRKEYEEALKGLEEKTKNKQCDVIYMKK